MTESSPSSMPRDSREVANMVLDLADAMAISIDSLSIQKILFFAHGLSLSRHDRPLVRQAFEAWEYGPVLRVVYQAFKDTEKGAPITKRAKLRDLILDRYVVAQSVFQEAERELLSEVVHYYGRINSFALVELTHQMGGPWEKVWSRKAFSPGGLIDNHLIVDYFREASDLHPSN